MHTNIRAPCNFCFMTAWNLYAPFLLFCDVTPPPSPPPCFQVSDQTYQHGDNAALLANYESGTPVRVFRAKMLQQQGPGGRVKPVRMYVYEGLYQVTEHRSIPSQDGPLVSTIVTGGPGFKSYSRQDLGKTKNPFSK